MPLSKEDRDKGLEIRDINEIEDSLINCTKCGNLTHYYVDTRVSQTDYFKLKCSTCGNPLMESKYRIVLGTN